MMWHNPKAFPQVWQHLIAPQHTAELMPGPNVVEGLLGTSERGNVVKWQLEVNKNNKMITAIRYQVYGCGFQLAVCSWWSMYMHGKTLLDLPPHPAEFLIERMSLPPEKKHTAYLAMDAFMQAVNKIANLK